MPSPKVIFPSTLMLHEIWSQSVSYMHMLCKHVCLHTLTHIFCIYSFFTQMPHKKLKWKIRLNLEFHNTSIISPFSIWRIKFQNDEVGQKLIWDSFRWIPTLRKKKQKQFTHLQILRSGWENLHDFGTWSHFSTQIPSFHLWRVSKGYKHVFCRWCELLTGINSNLH